MEGCFTFQWGGGGGRGFEKNHRMEGEPCPPPLWETLHYPPPITMRGIWGNLEEDKSIWGNRNKAFEEGEIMYFGLFPVIYTPNMEKFFPNHDEKMEASFKRKIFE